jgi:membrane dipeptidase
MLYVDAHCDTITKIMDNGEELYRNSCQIDLVRLGDRGSSVQFFAAFPSPRFGQVYALRRVIQIIDRFYRETEKNEAHMSICTNYNEIAKAIVENKVAAVLTVEDGSALMGELSVLRVFYQLGVRSVVLTWNNRNEIADGAGENGTGSGLTAFGKSVVREMNALGMLIDLSHISDAGFWDVIGLSKDPIIVSHSNARCLCNHNRNLTDEQIKAVAKCGGVIGINLYPPFLRESGKPILTDILRHIEYISGIAGCNHIGIGADFDGIEETPEGIGGVQDMEKVFNELMKLNYPEAWIRKLAGENFLRVIRQVLK